MKKEIAITLAYINLNSCINKLYFRLHKEPERKEGIQQQIDDLDQVRRVLNFIKSENEAMERRVLELEIRVLKAEESNNELKKLI